MDGVDAGKSECGADCVEIEIAVAEIGLGVVEGHESGPDHVDHPVAGGSAEDVGSAGEEVSRPLEKEDEIGNRDYERRGQDGAVGAQQNRFAAPVPGQAEGRV